jgi:hypothetical protein
MAGIRAITSIREAKRQNPAPRIHAICKRTGIQFEEKKFSCSFLCDVVMSYPGNVGVYAGNTCTLQREYAGFLP